MLFSVYFLYAFVVCGAPFSPKVPMPYGERFETGKVAEACESAGMKALCWGDETCTYTKNANSRQVSNESDFTLIEQLRCEVSQYNLGCGSTSSKNTLTKVQTPSSSSI